MSGPEVKRVVINRDKVEQMLRVEFDQEVDRQYQTMAIHIESDGYGGYVIHGMLKAITSAKGKGHDE